MLAEASDGQHEEGPPTRRWFGAVATGGTRPRDAPNHLDRPERPHSCIAGRVGIPWTVFGGGPAVIGGGALASALGTSSEMQCYQSSSTIAAPVSGLKPGQPADVQYLKDGAEPKGTLGRALMMTGGAGGRDRRGDAVPGTAWRSVYPEVMPIARWRAMTWSSLSRCQSSF